HRFSGLTVRRRYPQIENLQTLQLPPGVNVEQAISFYRNSGLVEYAEPDSILEAARVPNETNYTTGPLWNLFNWGQYGATTDADIDAAEGWGLATDAYPVLVDIITSGIRVTHEDLAANLWTNPGEIPGNGVDDDHNGYVDGVHGIGTLNHESDPTDDNGHATATA